MKSYSIFHIEHKMEFEKFNCFLANFLRYSFGRIKVISTVIERELYIRHNATDLLCISIDWFLYARRYIIPCYMTRGFTERYFLTGYGNILENDFYFVYAPDYCFKPSLFRIFCVNCSIKVFSLRHEGLSTHLFRTSSLCMFIIYRKKEIGFVAKFFSKYFFF